MVEQSSQSLMFGGEKNHSIKESPVECLGMTFQNDEERRNYFLEKLREKLKDPEFRKIEGFPIGSDEDILALSDPPYYTACPNPFIEDFIRCYGKPFDPKVPYSREPFAADVSEGKNDPIYNAHSYHTKVPHKAIMRYILHYTEPGDIVFDGFCGTGMTGVAAQLCGDKTAVESLGYKVREDGTILDEKGIPFSRLGARRAILNDLSPAATFIAHNYNTPVDVQEFEREAKRILREVEEECGWMYETLHSDGRLGRINYTVWSDVFICPECTREVVFWEAAVDKEEGKVYNEFSCPHCGAMLTKRNMERAWVTRYDKALKQTIRQAKQVPVLINYTAGGRRYEKSPDDADLKLIERVENSDIPYWFPTDEIPRGDKTGEPLRIGITHVHHFYTRRNLWALGAIYDRCNKDKQLLLLFNSQLINISKLNRYRPNVSFPYNPLSGTLYVSSQVSEANPFIAYFNKISRLVDAFNEVQRHNITECRSATHLYSTENFCEYIFTDPPFGGNLMYSELNFLWESWLKVFTNNKPEAITNDVQGKGLAEYQQLMTRCFEEYYRVLKPGRWMTVEFHNSRNSVWNAIQEALQRAGFVIADVRTLDKQQGSFNQVTAGGAVKQDIIISAYKPNGGLEERFKLEAGTEEGVWDFTRTHLKQLPVFTGKNGQLEIIAERQNYLLYDRMVAFHVQRGVTVPLSASEYYQGLEQRFPERDGMYFLPEQVAEYDKKRMTVKEILQLQLFVVDESSAIQWLRQQLTSKPQTAGDLKPQFMQEISGWQKNEKLLELDELLEQNFLKYDGTGDVPSQIHSYLSSNFKELRNLTKDDPALRAKAKDRWYVPDPNKAGDLEKLRERALLREFEEYRQSRQKQLKVFRLEAVRSGFKKAWVEHDYATIIDVAGKIPENVLQEDPKLLMWYDQALTRTGG
jgi:DNA modification methylase/predicted RNA-binding Zn-ribbon protein involved in translation (DUF1610 family)